MRQREPRRRVILPARMRLNGRWVDVSIRNLSSRGMLVGSDQPVERGVYVEIARGRHLVIGRAVWREDGTFGLRAQDRIDIDGIISKPETPTAQQPNGEPERRRTPRPPVDPARGERFGRHLQAAGLGVATLVAAALLAGTAYESMQRPFADIRTALTHGEQRLSATAER